MSTVKRFIASAVCPRCAVMDRVVIYEDGGKSVRECIDCGFRDVMACEPEPKELKTRSNRQIKTPQRTPTEAEPIRFYSNPKLLVRNE
ncbi:MAG: YheV family putative metal-binding protein [Endozoicomonadaceae bacterium]|nr:YheV family putative metal-binding protein [Endozoicomonadaceae bacterium]